MSQLSHASIVRCYSICRQRDSLYIVMELMGGDLLSHLKKSYVLGSHTSASFTPCEFSRAVRYGLCSAYVCCSALMLLCLESCSQIHVLTWLKLDSKHNTLQCG